MAVVLALDLGTTTGWATLGDSGQRHSGYVTFKNSRYEGGGMRYLKFSKWLEQLSPRPAEVYFEEVRRHKGTDAAHVYGGLLATLTSWCEQYGVPYQGVPVGTIKKHATGKGNAPKEKMIEAARQWAPDVTDDNEADALCLLDWAVHEQETLEDLF